MNADVRHTLVEVIGRKSVENEEDISLTVDAFGRKRDFDLSPVNLVSPWYSVEEMDVKGILRRVASRAQGDHYYIGRRNGETFTLRMSDDGTMVCLIHLCIHIQGYI